MSLRWKFAGLVAVLLLAVIVAVGCTAWSFGLLHKELSRPLRSAIDVARVMDDIKRGLEEESNILYGYGPEGATAGSSGAMAPGQGVRTARPDISPDRPSESGREQFERVATSLEESLALLQDNPWFVARTGRGAARAVEEHVECTHASARAWFAEADDKARHEAVWTAFLTHELIERSEQRLLDDAALAIDHGDRIRAMLGQALLFVLLLAGLVGLLSLVLIRRWVGKPIVLITEAARQYSAGRLDYRIPVVSRDEMGRLCEDINEMAETIGRLQREDVERERFAAVGQMVRRIAHNLRGPLSGIRGLAQATRASAEGDEDIRENQEQIVAAVDRFDRWVRDLMSSTGPQELSVEDHDVREWVRGVVESHAPLASSKNVELEVRVEQAPAWASFDSRQLEQAVTAILSNALEFTPREGAVSLSVGQEADAWWMRICDSGPGVPADVRERVFEPNFTTRRTGTGMGLALARHIARLHGGDVELMARNGDAGEDSGGGCVFVIRLPGAADGGQQPPPADLSQENGVDAQGAGN